MLGFQFLLLVVQIDDKSIELVLIKVIGGVSHMERDIDGACTPIRVEERFLDDRVAVGAHDTKRVHFFLQSFLQS